MTRTRVAVLKGGPSLERQVSLRSAGRVEDALEGLGHEVVPIDVDAHARRAACASRDADVAFVALHGRGGEDGTVQEILEIVGMPYTGSGVLGLHAQHGQGADEAHAGRGRACRRRTSSPSTRPRSGSSAPREALPAIEERLGFPIVVKPAAQGSALGIKFARSPEDVPEALIAAFSYDDKVLLERYVEGRELAVGLLEDDGGVEALPVVEAQARRRSTSSTSRRATRSARPTSSAPPTCPPASPSGRRSWPSTSTGCSAATASRAST